MGCEQSVIRVTLPWNIPFSHLLQLLEATHILWLVSSFSIFKARKYSTFKSLVLFLGSYNHISFLWPLTLLPLSYEEICDYIGPTWIVQGNLPLSRSLSESHLIKSLLQHKGHIHMLCGLEHGHLWWAINFVCYSLPFCSQRFMSFLHTKYIPQKSHSLQLKVNSSQLKVKNLILNLSVQKSQMLSSKSPTSGMVKTHVDL